MRRTTPTKRRMSRQHGNRKEHRKRRYLIIIATEIQEADPTLQKWKLPSRIKKLLSLPLPHCYPWKAPLPEVCDRPRAPRIFRKLRRVQATWMSSVAVTSSPRSMHEDRHHRTWWWLPRSSSNKISLRKSHRRGFVPYQWGVKLHHQWETI